MSRKGNSLDNELMEYFFRLLKSKIFYNQENKYKSLDELKNNRIIYIINNKRIKVKLKGLTPASYRNQSLKIA